MKFNEVIKHLIPPKEENPLSRLFGYQRDASGKMKVVPDEAKIISSVITALASRKSESVDKNLDDLLQQFFLEGVRNRSGKRWTRQSLVGLVRPIYSGITISKMGIWCKSKIYPAIVPIETLKTVMRRLKAAKLL